MYTIDFPGAVHKAIKDKLALSKDDHCGSHLQRSHDQKNGGRTQLMGHQGWVERS